MANARATNMNSSEIDSESHEKLKGDLIGDTMYSETFVLKTLLKLNNVEWCKDLEDDLCFLWDATIEEDVCRFLIAHDFLALAVGSVNSETDARLTEILYGILANIAVVDTSCIRSSDWDLILKNLSNEDPLVLIQIVRLVKTAAQNLPELTFLNEEVMINLVFILNNSLNKALLELTLDAFVKITTDGKLHVSLLKSEIYPAILEGYKNCKSTKTTTYVLQLLANTASYVNEGVLSSDVLVQRNGFLKVISEQLYSYRDVEDGDLCCREQLQFLIQALDYVCPILLLHNMEITRELLDLFNRISGNIPVHFYDELCNVVCFSVASLKSNQFSNFKDQLRVLDNLKNLKLHCDYDYLDNLNSIIQSLK